MDGPDPVATMSFDDLVAVSDKPAREVPDDRDRVVAIFPTGGTTGLSKAALLPQRVWETVISTFWTCCPTTSPPVCLVATPMTHGGGGVALFMQPAGTTTVLLRQADPVAIMKAIQEHRVTQMFMPPTLVYMILAHPDVGAYDLSSLEYLIVAGAPIAPEKLQEALDVFNGAVCQSFGQAEAPFMLTFLSSHDLRTADRTRKPDRFASCGRPTIGSQVAIMDDGGAAAPSRRDRRAGRTRLRRLLQQPGGHRGGVPLRLAPHR